MEEVLDGVWHWAARHPKLGIIVSSYWLEAGGVLIDPLVPEHMGLEWFAARSRRPAEVLLSNRHHLRDSVLFAERFDCRIHCNLAGLPSSPTVPRSRASSPATSCRAGSSHAPSAPCCPDETSSIYRLGVRSSSPTGSSAAASSARVARFASSRTR